MMIIMNWMAGNTNKSVAMKTPRLYVYKQRMGKREDCTAALI